MEAPCLSVLCAVGCSLDLESVRLEGLMGLRRLDFEIAELCDARLWYNLSEARSGNALHGFIVPLGSGETLGAPHPSPGPSSPPHAGPCCAPRSPSAGYRVRA